MQRHNPTPNQRPRISRYSTLSSRIATLMNILGDGKPHKAAELAQYIGVNSRTIRRTLHLMRDELGLPIETGREGFWLTQTQGLNATLNSLPIPAVLSPEATNNSQSGARLWADKGSNAAAMMERN